MTRIPQTAYKKNAIGDLPMAFLFTSRKSLA